MKKKLLAVAVAGVLAPLVATSAFAQTTISGSVNVGILDTGASGAKAAVASLGGGANHISIGVLEDLGGGLKSGVDLQMRFNSATGDRSSNGTGNALFHVAKVNLMGSFGTFEIGKIAEASNAGFDPWGAIGTAGLIAGSGTTTALIGGQTQAGSLRYTTPTMNGLSASYQRTLTTGKTAGTHEDRSVLNLSYAQGPIAVQLIRTDNQLNVTAESVAYVTTGAASGYGLSAIGGSGTSFGASYDFGVAKVGIVNARTKSVADVTTLDITAIMMSMPINKQITLLAAYGSDSKVASTVDAKFGIGVNYALSTRTTLGADLWKQDQVGGNTGFAARVRHTF